MIYGEYAVLRSGTLIFLFDVTFVQVGLPLGSAVSCSLS